MAVDTARTQCGTAASVETVSHIAIWTDGASRDANRLLGCTRLCRSTKALSRVCSLCSFCGPGFRPEEVILCAKGTIVSALLLLLPRPQALACGTKCDVLALSHVHRDRRRMWACCRWRENELARTTPLVSCIPCVPTLRRNSSDGVISCTACPVC